MAANTRAFSRKGIVKTGFGSNGVGACAVEPTVKGDIIVGVFNITTGASASSQFETVATVTGQVQQTSSNNNSTLEFDFMIQPAL